MSDKRWMIYGATGYTGKLLIEEAVKRGHQPVIAGRNEAKLRPLAEQYGLEAIVFALPDAVIAVDALQEMAVDAVLHAAGPFTFTADPMRTACLQTGTHYLDITGEIPVFEATFAQDSAAREAGILLMSGVGFDIVPSDCLVKYVADALPDAVEIEIAISALEMNNDDMGITAGTLKSLLEMLPNGNLVRRGGEIIPVDFGADFGTFRFPTGMRQAVAIPWGDVSTAYHTSGIRNVTTYMTMPPAQIRAIRYGGVILQWLVRAERVRQFAGRQIDRYVTGPSDHTRQTSRSYIYARARNASGAAKEAWLETIEGYTFTAISAVRAVERALTGDHTGAQTPAGAFGADFVLEIEGSQRYDTLDGQA